MKRRTRENQSDCKQRRKIKRKIGKTSEKDNYFSNVLTRKFPATSGLRFSPSATLTSYEEQVLAVQTEKTSHAFSFTSDKAPHACERERYCPLWPQIVLRPFWSEREPFSKATDCLRHTNGVDGSGKILAMKKPLLAAQLLRSQRRTSPTTKSQRKFGKSENSVIFTGKTIIFEIIIDLLELRWLFTFFPTGRLRHLPSVPIKSLNDGNPFKK